MKLTKREFFLIYVLIYVALTLFSLNFFIIPKISEYKENSEEILDLQYLIKEQTLKIEDFNKEQTIYDALFEKYEENESSFNSYTENDEIEEYLIPIAQKNNLNPTGFYCEEDYEINLEQSTIDENLRLVVKHVIMTFTGNINDLPQFIDDVCKEEYIEVQSADYDSSLEVDSIRVEFVYYLLGREYNVKKQ